MEPRWRWRWREPSSRTSGRGLENERMVLLIRQEELQLLALQQQQQQQQQHSSNKWSGGGDEGPGRWLCNQEESSDHQPNHGQFEGGDAV
ncbi:hypothetical protein NL676_012418 [Syzygium grande]|nr:hypothetical protein NL676_012418 [Syzygium grande]